MGYATEMVASDRLIMLYVPIFLIALVLFLFGVSLEIRSLWSSSAITFTSSQVFYQFQAGATTIWSTLVFIQTVWGLSFLKEACIPASNSVNFCISGNSVEWYFSKKQQ